MSLKLGKLPAQPRPKDFKWADLSTAVTLPSHPIRFGHANLFPGEEWKMLGNGPDNSVAPGFGGAGDCVLAGRCHEIRMINKVVNHIDVPFTGKEAIAAYSAVTGYVVGDDSTDNGTDMHDAASYSKNVGIADALGKRHKIGAYVFLDPKNWEQYIEAIYIFLAAGIGFLFPASAWRQFDDGEPWDVVANDGGIDGGHYVPGMGEPRRGVAGEVTWARRQEMTQAFYEKYNDEAVVYITDEQLRITNARDVHGFDIEKLNALLAAL